MPEYLENFRPVPVLAAATAGRKTPVREFLLFPWGASKTSKGDLQFDRESAQELMRRYREGTERRDGWLDIDFAHLSQTNEDNPAAHVSAGKFRTETRDDGQWVTDLTYPADVYEGIATERWKYYSPVVNFDENRRVVELLQLALTNIPAMKNAQPLALSTRTSEQGGTTGGNEMRFSRLLLLSLALNSRVETTPELLEARPGMMELLRGLVSALSQKLPGAHLEDVYEDHAVCGIPTTESGRVTEQYMRVPYSVKDGMVSLGEPIKVRKQWTPVDGSSGETVESEKLAQLSTRATTAEDRVKTVESMLLTATGKQSVSAAIGEVERLRAAEGASAGLKGRLEALEQRSFAAERSVLLGHAKRDGKWTQALETLADRSADRARKLGEDPLEAVREVFSAAPVVVAPGQVQQPRPEQGTEGSSGLSAEEERICLEQAKATGRKPEEYRAAYLSMKQRFSR